MTIAVVVVGAVGTVVLVLVVVVYFLWKDGLVFKQEVQIINDWRVVWSRVDFCWFVWNWFNDDHWFFIVLNIWFVDGVVVILEVVFEVERNAGVVW